MAWFLQTPDDASPKLLMNIVSECGAASKGAAAFAFASAMGVKQLIAELEFQKFLKASEFVAAIGLDGITDTKAVEELRKVRERYPNFKPRLFLHDTAGSCFHPKTMWLKTAKGGVIITGSGNLTSGGLKANWESTAVEKLNAAEMNAAEAVWDAWIKAHKKQLLDLDDPTALEKAKAKRFGLESGRVLLRHARPRYAAAPWPTIAPPRTPLPGKMAEGSDPLKQQALPCQNILPRLFSMSGIPTARWSP